LSLRLKLKRKKDIELSFLYDRINWILEKDVSDVDKMQELTDCMILKSQILENDDFTKEFIEIPDEIFKYRDFCSKSSFQARKQCEILLCQREIRKTLNSAEYDGNRMERVAELLDTIKQINQNTDETKHFVDIPENEF
jgi:uncharacterized protein (DUF2384 family)